MGEIKSVKVDNWGVFFLQKLQNFFNKTDYCDLTLQFQDNSQLKVHRLVLSACTDYFNVLEQTCEVVDDAIIMPTGLQADVVVPIVNFMYTGTLEFELKMYNRLLRTAKDMNMTVLLKLLEAHRRTMEMHPQKASGLVIPKLRRRTANPASVVNPPSNASGSSSFQTNQVKRAVVGTNVNTANRNVSASSTLTRVHTSSAPLPLRQIGSTTFTRIKVENEQQDRPAPSSGAYSLIKHAVQQQSQLTSPFEQLRKGYNNNKRPAVSTFVSPPAKKPNLEDVKEFAEQQRMRKQIAAEYGDDDYDASNIMDDDTIHNDDDDDEMMTSGGQSHASHTLATSTSAGVQTVASSTSQQSEDPPGTTTIIVKQEGPDKPPTIVVKDNSNSKLNHAKIISEVIRQYPHLVKGNKNIKLKIMPNSGGQTQKIIVKKDATDAEKQNQQTVNTIKMSDNQKQPVKTLASNILANRPKNLQNLQSEISSSGKTNSSATQAALSKSSSTTNATSATGQPQKRRIDSKTMHALIALGAENTTGPWLCLRCGRNGHPISIPSYRGFRRHLINTHKEIIDPALCEHCGWRSASKRELHFHMQLDHKVRTNLYIFPECQLCQQMCIDSDGLNQHLIDSHPDENKQQCIYCNKIFPVEIQLYTHMKTFHKKQALEDGIIDYSDDENQAQPLPPLPPIQYEHEIVQEQKETQQTKKIKILSDISLPIARSIVKSDTFVAQQDLATSVASEEQEHDQNSIETKFVGADGSEVFLTAEQRKEILSQLNQEHEGSGIVMVLNANQRQQHPDQGAISHDETSQATTATNEEREEEGEEEEQVAEEHDDQHDDNQIYNEMKALHSNLEDDCNSQTEAAAEAGNDETSIHEEEQEEQDDVETEAEHDESAEQHEESKESMENLEWAENLISEHDLADEVLPQHMKENNQDKKTEEKKEMEKEIQDEDNKSQDEISKKLKELTGDWSEDDEDDIPEEEPLAIISQPKDNVKEKEPSAEDAKMTEDKEKETNEESQAKEQKDNQDIEEHAELLASLQNSDIEETEKTKKNIEAIEELESIDEDDIDKALKSLHKGDLEEEYENTKETEKEEAISEKNGKKDDNDELEQTEQTAIDEVDNVIKKEDVEEKTSTSVESTKLIRPDEIKSEQKVLKDENNAIHEPETTSSTMEVDEKTKKDLLDSLLSEQAETMEDIAAETLTKGENKVENKTTDESVMDNKQSEEFLDDIPEKKENSDDHVITTTTAETAAPEEATKLAEDTSSSAKAKSTLSSEEQVKSLISEWGDDEDDDDENASDLAKDL